MGRVSVNTDATAGVSKWMQPARLWPVLWLIISAMLIIGSWNIIVTRAGWDPDDQLRFVQLRDFLAGQSWFDNTQYRINPPDGAPMHWSRLIELPLALVVLIIKPFFGQAVAEMVAGSLIPLIALGLTAAMAGKIAVRLGGIAPGAVAFLLTMLSATLLPQFRPMRIDHHGWQITLSMLALWTMFWPDKKRAGIVLGISLATWLHISLEGLPAAAAFFLLLGWRWIVDKAHGQRLFWTITTFALATPALFFGTQPLWLNALPYCDSISPPYLAAIGLAAAVMVPAIALKPDNRLWRLAMAALAGFAALSSILLIAPQCSRGAFGTLDPLVRDYWYMYINEGLPMWHQDWQIITFVMAPPLCGLLALRYLNSDNRQEEKGDRLTAAYFLIYALIISLLVFRTVTVATVFAIPLIAVWIVQLFAQYRKCEIPLKRVSYVALMIGLVIPGILASQAVSAVEKIVAKPVASKAQKNDEEPSLDGCSGVASITALNALPPSRLIAPFDIGPRILMNTPHMILATGHHRNEKAMHDHIEIFRSKPDTSRTFIEKHDIAYVVACPEEPELFNYRKKNPEGLWGTLYNKRPPNWLRRMPDMGKGIQVWRVIR